VRLLPEALAAADWASAGRWVPLFLVILIAVASGVLIGFVWEWFREMRIRGMRAAHRAR
jgi:putative membrane protein